MTLNHIIIDLFININPIIYRFNVCDNILICIYHLRTCFKKLNLTAKLVMIIPFKISSFNGL